MCAIDTLNLRAPRTLRRALLFALSLPLLWTTGAHAVTHEVTIGGETPAFRPDFLTIEPGDTVKWIWINNGPHSHSVTSGISPNGDGKFSSPIKFPPYTYSHTFHEKGRFDYFCATHTDAIGYSTVAVIQVGAPPAAAAQPLNVSTRLRVQTGQNAMIGGFIITGTALKRVIVRALGPSLGAAGVTDVLTDPIVSLYNANGPLLSNDNWRDNQQADIQASGVAPSDERESAIVTTLAPGSYTAVVEGKNQATGVGLVEVYDLDQPADAKLANISTRGVVEAGGNVMIGGFILGKGTQPARVIVRALGPSLTEAGIAGALADPILDLRDANGELVRTNNNWKDQQQTEIEATGVPPRHEAESAIIATIPPASYTAIVSGVGNTTGVGLVEVYALN